MIARPIKHYDDRSLERLLDESLGVQETHAIESHLSGCEQCQSKLQQLAGDAPWWTETSEALSGTHPTLERASEAPVESTIESVSWLQTILRTSNTPTKDTPGNDNAGALGQIDHYDIQAMVGQGGMGVVLKGNDPTLNRLVALKILSPHLAGVGAARSRFKREAKSAAAIVHPAVVPIYAIVADGEFPYLVMPLIEGGNLQQRLDREGPLPIEEVLRIGAEVAEGLEAAHARGVIHRDIKPANLLIEKGNGRVLISDFGLARALDDATVTMSGMIAGTPSYMSPEQARGETTTTASDWFSFGAVLYALCTGRAPYRAECPLAVLRKITDTDAKPVHEINESMAPWMNLLVSKFMNRDVNERIRSGSDAVALLRAAHLHVKNPSLHPLPDSLVSSKQVSRPLFFGCLLAVAALLAMAAGFQLLSVNSNADASVDSKLSPGTSLETKREVALEQISDADTDPVSSLPRNETSWRDDELEQAIDDFQLELTNANQ